MWKNSSKAAVPEILRPAYMAPTTTLYSKSLKSHLFLILMLSLKLQQVVLVMSTWLNA